MNKSVLRQADIRNPLLPGKSGYQICREIRDKLDIPILVVTARTESVDKVRGLGLGADDYISKPFDPAELVARVNANLRQYQRMVEKFANKGPDASEEIQVQDLRILVNSWKVFKGDTEIRFPNREFELLKFLAMNPNIVFSREKLFEKIWGYDYVGDSYPNSGGATVFLADGPDHRNLVRDQRGGWKNIAVPGSVRTCHRSILAVLLPCPAGRPGKCGGAYRQAEHSGYHRIFVGGI